MSTWLVTGDWHLTDNPRDNYRWGLFPWLYEKIGSLGMGPKTMFILGDLTVDKDRHSATLVNNVVDRIVSLYRAGLHKIIIVPGNHDGLDKIYFEFLKHLPYVDVITEPEVRMVDLRTVALLPHTRRDPLSAWNLVEFKEVQYGFLHATHKGAISESGHSLEGVDLSWLSQYRARFLSGDVHVPQKIGPVEYVGAPYPIRFGDNFKGRVLCLQHLGKKFTEESWYFQTIRKQTITIRSVESLKKVWPVPRKGDQLKFRVELEKSELHEFNSVKDGITAWCEKKEADLCGVELVTKQKLKFKGAKTTAVTTTPHEALNKYVKKAEVADRTAKTGRKLLKVAAPEARQRLRLAS
jgi:hypothetical protein